MPTNQQLLYGLHTTIELNGNEREWLAHDYDYLTLDRVKDECKELIDDYLLGPYYILESSPAKYHAVNFTPVHPSTARVIQQETGADDGHQRIHSQRQNATIRISKKRSTGRPPTLLAIVNSPHTYLEHSGIRNAYFTKLAQEHDITPPILDTDNLKMDLAQ